MSWLINLLISTAYGAAALLGVNIVLFLLSQGNPAYIRLAYQTKALTKRVPKSTVFVCEDRAVVAKWYDARQDEERVTPPLLQITGFGFSLLTAWKGAKGPTAIARIATAEIAMRYAFLILFLVPVLVVFGALSVFHDWRWSLALALLLVHQAMCFDTGSVFMFTKLWGILPLVGLVFAVRSGWSAQDVNTTIWIFFGFSIISMVAIWLVTRSEQKELRSNMQSARAS